VAAFLVSEGLEEAPRILHHHKLNSLLPIRTLNRSSAKIALAQIMVKGYEEHKGFWLLKRAMSKKEY
jgi:hypothetical protein